MVLLVMVTSVITTVLIYIQAQGILSKCLII